MTADGRDLADEALNALLGQVWDGLAQAVADRRAAWRTVVFSTVDAFGAPQARMVVLRGFEPQRGRLTIHSDARAAKVQEVQARPDAVLVAWDPVQRLQARIDAIARLTAPEETEEILASLSADARAAYTNEPAPGAPLTGARAYAPWRAEPAFQPIHLTIVAIDALTLDPDGHRRARFAFKGGAVTEAAWLSP